MPAMMSDAIIKGANEPIIAYKAESAKWHIGLVRVIRVPCVRVIGLS